MTSMMRPMMVGKIHRATVTHADLHYVGSITIDMDLLEAADLPVGHQVDVVNITNGSRLTTYVIAGERGSGEICINGAAAHHVNPGDLVIIIGYAYLADDHARTYTPRVVFVDENNQIITSHTDPGQVPAGYGLESRAVGFGEAQTQSVGNTGVTYTTPKR